MQNRRFTRLTNGHSKKVRNHELSVALYTWFYNFARPHSSLEGKQTPAMAAGIIDRKLTIQDLVRELDSK